MLLPNTADRKWFAGGVDEIIGFEMLKPLTDFYWCALGRRCLAARLPQ
jgi:hypothetical protein